VGNSLSALPGIVGVYLTGWMIEVTGRDWRSVFLLAASIATLGGIIYIIFVRTHEIDYDKKEKAMRKNE